jgi:hypothetical protein
MTVDEGFDDEPTEPPIKTEIGEVYYVRWTDGAENLFLKNKIYSWKPIASHMDDKAELSPIKADDFSFCPKWGLVKKIKHVPMKNLPLYVSWNVGETFAKMIRDWPCKNKS